MIYKFVRWDIPSLETFANTTPYILHEKLKSGQTLTREERNSLVFSTHDPIRRVHGWAFDYRQYLCIFWVQTKYSGIQQYYALDKTAIRTKLRGCGDPLIKIVQVK